MTTYGLNVINNVVGHMTNSIGHMTKSLVRGMIMLEPLFESEIKEKILLYLYTNGESYPREIASTFEFYVNAVQNQLLNLESAGVLYSKLKGKVRLFGINPRYPFKKELEALLEKVLIFIPEKDKKKYYIKRLRPRRTKKPF